MIETTELPVVAWIAPYRLPVENGLSYVLRTADPGIRDCPWMPLTDHAAATAALQQANERAAHYEQLHHVSKLGHEQMFAEAQAANARAAALAEALRELVALEELRLLIELARAHPIGTVFEDMSTEYARAKPLAVAAARSALSSLTEQQDTRTTSGDGQS